MLDRLKVGPLGENAYVLAGDGYCILVDPGAEAKRIISFLDAQQLVPTLIVATHGHFDHTAAMSELLETWRSRGIAVPVAAHGADKDYFGAKGEETNRALFTKIGALPYFEAYWRPLPSLDILLSEGDTLPGSSFIVIHSPGHTEGSICLHDAISSLLVSGDTLFRDGIGRSDGPDSDPAELEASVNRLLELPPSTRVFPGHGGETTIGRESGKE